MTRTIDELASVIAQRRQNPTGDSYTARLFAAGEDEIVKKVGEEAVEIILAVKGQGNARLVEEAADLVYHLLVLLESRGLSWGDVELELERRRK